LHDIGYIVNTTAHHKHAMYLILNSGLFGLGSKDLMLVALIARYHRRAIPKAAHEEYGTLDPESRLAVAKLAAILRVADALDRSYSQRIQQMECTREGDRLVITASSVDDLFLEQLAVRQKGPMFEDVYGLQVQLRRT
jgi:exopolyphosphatase/guanosine-5'-triphosphate,3'-diphosphate pyrophosphatase